MRVWEEWPEFFRGEGLLDSRGVQKVMDVRHRLIILAASSAERLSKDAIPELRLPSARPSEPPTADC